MSTNFAEIKVLFFIAERKKGKLNTYYLVNKLILKCSNPLINARQIILCANNTNRKKNIIDILEEITIMKTSKSNIILSDMISIKTIHITNIILKDLIDLLEMHYSSSSSLMLQPYAGLSLLHSLFQFSLFLAFPLHLLISIFSDPFLYYSAVIICLLILLLSVFH